MPIIIHKTPVKGDVFGLFAVNCSTTELYPQYLTYLNPTLSVSSCVADLTETEKHKNVKMLIHFLKWKAVENFMKSLLQMHTEYQLGGYNEIRTIVWFLEFTIKWEETATSGAEMW